MYVCIYKNINPTAGDIAYGNLQADIDIVRTLSVKLDCIYMHTYKMTFVMPLSNKATKVMHDMNCCLVTSVFAPPATYLCIAKLFFLKNSFMRLTMYPLQHIAKLHAA